MSYKKPTLTEVYTEVFLAEGSLEPRHIFDISGSLREMGLAEVEFVHHAQTEAVLELLPKVRFWDPEKVKLVQLVKDRVIVNQLKEYSGWVNFREVFQAIIKIVKENLENFNCKSLGFTTIDKFEVPSDGYSLSKWLNCNGEYIPKWLAVSKETCDVVIGRGLVNTEGFNRRLNIQVRKGENTFSIRIESGFRDQVKQEEDVYEKLEGLHRESTEFFEKIITDDLRLDVMGGQV